jgi:hypothetical protein
LPKIRPCEAVFHAWRKVMAQDVQGMLIKIEATTAQLRKEMQNAESVVGNSTKGIDSSLSRADKAFDRLNANGSRSLGQLGGGFNVLAASVKAATGALAAFSVASILKSALSEQEQLQRNMLRTEALITATGGAAGFSAKQLHEQARALNSVTLGSTEGIMKAQQIMLSFDKVSGDTFTRGIELAMDMSSTIEGGLSSSVTMLGKALQDPIKGLTAMSKAGVSFNSEQTDLIKKMVAVGDAAGAQEVILKALAGNYGGVARNEAKGLAGAQDTLSQSIQEAEIALADQLQMSDAAADGYNAMSKVVVALGDNVDVLVRGGEILAVMIGGRLVAAAGMSAASFVTAQIAAMRYQATLARMAGVSASTAVGLTAMSVAARTASAAMALLGGPVGAAIIAASAIFYFGTRASKAERETEALDKRLAKLGGSFDKLNADQAAASIVDYTTKLDAAQMVAEAAAAKVFTLNDNIARFPGSPKQEQWRAELVQAKGAAADANEVVGEQNVIIAQLTEITNRNTDAKAANNGTTVEGTKAGEKYLAQLQEQTAKAQDKTAVQAAGRVITENQIGLESELGKQIMVAAAAQDAQRAADAKSTAGTKTGNKAIDERIKAIDAMVDKYDPAAKAQADYTKGVELADKALADGTYTAEQYQKVIEGLYTELNKPAWDKFNAGADASTAALKRVDESVQSVLDRLDPISAATRDYADEQKLLSDAMARYPENAEQYRRALELLGNEYRDNQRASSEWGQLTERALDSVDQSFADAWKNIDKGFSGFADSLKDAFKNLLAELAHLAITRPILMQVGAALGVGGLAGQSSGLLGSLGGGGGSGGGLGDIFSMGKNAYSVFNSGFGQAVAGGWNSGTGFFGGLQGAASSGWQYGTSALGDLGSTAGGWFGGGAGAGGAGYQIGQPVVSGGVGSASYASGSLFSGQPAWGSAGSALAGVGGALYGYGQSGLKGAVTGGAGAYVGAAIGSIAGPIGTAIGAALGGYIGGSLFSGKWQTKDGGIALSAQNGDVSGQSYKYQKKKGGLFSSNKKRTRFSDLDADTVASLQAAYDATEDTVAGLFSELGLSVEEGTLDGLQIAQKQISTQGKTGEQIQEAIAEWFGTVAEAMNTELNSVFGTGLGLDFAGMQAFVGNLYGVNEVLRYLDVQMYESSVAGGKLALSLSEAAGGLESLAASSQTYYDKFFSGVEKQADALDAVNRQFEAAGLALPDTRSDYRAMVEDIDLTTASGRSMFATLMNLAGSADAAFSIMEAQALEASQMLAAAMSGYYMAFTSETERADDTLSAVTATFAALNIALPDTRAGFRAMVDGLDMTTEAGQRMFETLTGLAGPAADAFAILEQRAAAAAAAAIAASRGMLGTLSGAITAQKTQVAKQYQAQADAIGEAMGRAGDAVSEMGAVAGTLRSSLKSMRLESETLDAANRKRAQATIQSALTASRGGQRVTMTDELSRALDTAAGASAGLFGSFVDYQRDYWQTYLSINALAETAEVQLSADEKMVKALEGQIDQAKAWQEAEVERLDGILSGAETQLNALLGIDSSVKSVEEALSLFASALGAAQSLQNANSSVTSVTGLAGIKRQVSSEGYILDEFGQAMTLFGEAMRVVGDKVLGGNGSSLDIGSSGQLSWGSGAYSDWASGAGIPGFAMGGEFGGGLRLVGENGPELEVTGPSRIYNAGQTAAMLNGGSDSAEEIRALRAEVAGLNNSLRAIAKHTMKTSKHTEYLERFDVDGMPAVRTA